MDKILLMFLSFLIFVNNKEITNKVFFITAILCFFIVSIYIAMFFYYKKEGKKFILNFFKLSLCIECLLGVAVLFFGINSFITFNILFVSMIDIFYKVFILSAILNLKKRFSIQ